MPIITIMAFAILFFQAEQPGRFVLVPDDDIVITLLVVWLQPVLLGGAAWVLARKALRRLQEHPQCSLSVHHFHQVAKLWLGVISILGFAAGVWLTRWPLWMAFGRIHPVYQLAGDMVVLVPFVATILAMWTADYPLECALRGRTSKPGSSTNGPARPHWRLRSYLDFQLRHQLLIMAIPLLMILFVADLTRGYEERLRAMTGWFWTPDALLGTAALGVFVSAPLILTKIWRTTPLPADGVRARLESICRRINLRCRDILIWQSDGLMINAAVMGFWAPVRYVLLSDALLDNMTEKQIEAVFGHEAGHVRHRHIQHFLVFALAGWLLVAGLMEVLARLAFSGSWRLSSVAIQGFGVVATFLFWGFGFGWVSRRFERQADLFGARCVAPADAADCSMPCSVHLDERTVHNGEGRVCATGAAVFASALDRVAVLNGIPHEERSWRHSSIGSRIRFLTSLASDPARTSRFEKLVARIKMVMLVTAAIGAVGWLVYGAATRPIIWQL